MKQNSLGKNKIKIVLLEGIHESAEEVFRADGYTEIEIHKKALTGRELLK